MNEHEFRELKSSICLCADRLIGYLGELYDIETSDDDLRLWDREKLTKQYLKRTAMLAAVIEDNKEG